MIKFIKTTFFGYVHSVESITAGFVKTVEALEAHAVAQAEQATSKTMEAARLLKERQAHDEEGQKARLVAAKIKGLLA